MGCWEIAGAVVLLVLAVRGLVAFVDGWLQ